MEFKSTKLGSHTLIHLNGRLDISNSDEVDMKLAPDIQSGIGDIIINLSGIPYISSSGIRVFVSLVRELDVQGRKLKLCNITPPVKKIFDVVELLDLFEVYESEEEAIASL